MNFQQFIYMVFPPCGGGGGIVPDLDSSMPGFGCRAVTDPACLQVELSQDDLSMLLKIPLENLGEASSLGQPSHKQDVSVHLQTSESSSTGTSVQIEADRSLQVIHFPLVVDFRCDFSFSRKVDS